MDNCLTSEHVANQSEENLSIFNLPANIENPDAAFYWYKFPSKENPFVFNWEKRLCKKIEKAQYDKLISLNAKEVLNLDFEEKQMWFFYQIEKLRISWMNGSDQLTIRKDFILEDTLKKLDSFDLHKELKITFLNDKVLDAGGLMREWVHLLMKEFVKVGLFEKADTENMTYKLSGENDADNKFVDYARIFGYVLAKAIFEKVPISLYLDRPLLRALLCQEVELIDIGFFDKGLYQSWQFVKENDLTAQSGFDEVFEIFHKNNGKFESYELKPDGRNIKIVQTNKDEYLELSIDFYTKQIIVSQLTAFLEGFYKVIPLEILQVFEINELEMIIYGTPLINLEDWKTNSIYKGAYYSNHQIIQWFWEIISGFSQEELAKILQFCTGSSRTPIDGFRNLMSNRGKIAKFCIESSKFSKENSFPKGHTCFNRLELPMYPSKEVLKEKLVFLVKSDLEGVFGLE